MRDGGKTVLLPERWWAHDRNLRVGSSKWIFGQRGPALFQQAGFAASPGSGSVGYNRSRSLRRPNVRTSASGAIALIVACSVARLSWIEAITGPIGTPTSTSTASESWRLASIVSGTASEAPVR